MVKLLDIYCKGNYGETEKKDITWADLCFYKVVSAALEQETEKDKRGRWSVRKAWLSARYAGGLWLGAQGS